MCMPKFFLGILRSSPKVFPQPICWNQLYRCPIPPLVGALQMHIVTLICLVITPDVWSNFFRRTPSPALIYLMSKDTKQLIATGQGTRTSVSSLFCCQRCSYCSCEMGMWMAMWSGLFLQHEKLSKRSWWWQDGISPWCRNDIFFHKISLAQHFLMLLSIFCSDIKFGLNKFWEDFIFFAV